MRAGVLVFPGSNCDRDLISVLENEFQIQTEILWHTEHFEPHHDLYFLPGGFSYGDYLRTGALAAQCRSIASLRRAAQNGRPVVGICNGFQILCEAKLLPGALVRNRDLLHICEWVPLAGAGRWQDCFPENFALPISHGEGNFLCNEDELKAIEDRGQVLLRYRENPNGSLADIAGICSPDGRIIGLMPHPERALRPSLDLAFSRERFGRLFFEKVFSLVSK
ncbi:MAG: phosphoribosylformylglycinamidine synthase subunit PurQ [Turneriella sp.]|nr:phosphoribosylformylglycinamidine synthase subunit PurQ [Turneriella sp.]